MLKTLPVAQDLCYFFYQCTKNICHTLQNSHKKKTMSHDSVETFSLNFSNLSIVVLLRGHPSLSLRLSTLVSLFFEFSFDRKAMASFLVNRSFFRCNVLIFHDIELHQNCSFLCPTSPSLFAPYS